MIIRLIYFFITYSFLLGVVQAQTANDCSYKPPREAENWCFYKNIKLQFNGESITQSDLPPSLNLGKGCASISDKDGNLLLFTDGIKLWDKNAGILSNTLDGDYGSCQSALIVPRPKSNQQYYIFTVDHLMYPSPIFTKGLNYSFIDLSVQSGSADTLPVKKLLVETPEKLTGVLHANGYDYWVVAHGWNNDAFYSYKVTAAGIDSIPVTSNVGTIQSGTFVNRTSVGYMKLSPDGSKLALAIMGNNLIEWFHFDNSSGKVSAPHQLSSPDAGSPYGIEFSPDGKYLYFTTVNSSTNATNNLYQLDLELNTPPLLLTPLPLDLTALQLAVDGKIYCSRYYQPFLGVIENPNRNGTACNFSENGLNLNGIIAPRGLPNFIQSYFNIPAITYDTKCLGDETYLNLTNTANIDSISWDFGDPATGSSNFDNTLRPSHRFSVPGMFNVKATEWFNNLSFESNISVKINDLPPKSFEKDSTYILPGSAIMLDGGDLMKTYLWQDGSAAQLFEASQPGFYNVIIIDTNCCLQSDTIKIMFLDLYVPNAFSPNNDGHNDRFSAIGPTEGIIDYQFYIYNRWGQLVWETDNLFDSWDGTLNGNECPVGMYIWAMKFGVSGDLLNKDKVAKRGTITLLR